MAEARLQFLIDLEDRVSPGMQKVQTNLDNFKGQVEKMQPAFKKMAAIGTAGFAAVTGAVALSVKQFANAGDEIQKMALRTGFSTIALSELKHAAELSGTSIQAMEKAIMRSNQTLQQADDESMLAVRALERLGLTVAELEAIPIEDRFFKMAEAVAEIEDPGRRSATAMEVFGKQGVNLLPMLAAGAEGIQQMRDEAHELGIVFDQEAADAAAKFNDDMDRLGKSFTGVRNAVASAFIPVLTDLVEKMRGPIMAIQAWAAENPGLVRTIIVVVSALFGLVAVAGTLGLVILPVIAGFGALATAIAFIASPVGLIIVALAALGFAIYYLWKNWETHVDNMKWAFTAFKDWVGGIVDWVKDKFGAFVAWIDEKVQAVLGSIRKALDAVKSIPGVGAVAGVASAVGGGIGSAIGAVGRVIGVNDAIITPRGDIVKTHPDDFLIATKRPDMLGGAGIVVNVSGNNFYGDEDLAEKVMRVLNRQLQNNVRI